MNLLLEGYLRLRIDMESLSSMPKVQAGPTYLCESASTHMGGKVADLVIRNELRHITLSPGLPLLLMFVKIRPVFMPIMDV